MDEQALHNWQILHRRHVMGEILNAEEQTIYEAGCRELDATERLNGKLERIRELRAAIAAAEQEQHHLRKREKELDARIAGTSGSKFHQKTQKGRNSLMTAPLQELTLHLPGELIERISETADRRQLPLDQVVIEALETSLPPLRPSSEANIEIYKERFQSEPTEALYSIMDARLPKAEQKRLSQLMEVNRTRTLTPEENEEIESLLDQVEARATERAVAMLVLKERSVKNNSVN